MKFDEVYLSKEVYFCPEHSGGMEECLKNFHVEPCEALDIGAGEGRNSLYLTANGFKVAAVEPSLVGARKIQENAKKHGLDISVINSDFLMASAAMSNKGFVVALTSLEHMDYEYLCESIEEIKRLLAPGGYFYAIVFTEEDPGFMRDCANASECAMFVRHYFKKNELRRFFSDFEILVYKEYVKEDNTHGYAHYHGKAKIFARKPQNWERRAENGLQRN